MFLHNTCEKIRYLCLEVVLHGSLHKKLVYIVPLIKNNTLFQSTVAVFFHLFTDGKKMLAWQQVPKEMLVYSNQEFSVKCCRLYGIWVLVQVNLCSGTQRNDTGLYRPVRKELL